MKRTSEQTVYFTGFMASGKSRIGRAVADRLQRPFVDTDSLIAERAGKTISEIFTTDGEAAFRKMERDLIEEIAREETPKIVALGGGALTQAPILECIRHSGMLVRLWATPEVLSERIGRKATRPLMAGLPPEERLKKIREMLEEREQYYSHADFSVESSNDFSEDHVVERVVALLKFWDASALHVETRAGDRYPIFIGKNLIANISNLLEGLRLAPSHAFLICTDTTIAKAQSNLLNALRIQAGQCPIFKFRAGEINKNLNSLNQLYTYMLRRHFSRRTCLLQFSGGVVGDMAGFGAATYQRGVPFIQIPTTLLSMVDSSVGGKVAVNHPEGKNMIGAFYQPRAVLCDLDTLSTLPPEEYLAGLAEVVKYGVIYDEPFFHFMEENIEKIKNRDLEVLSRLIHRSCEIKAEVVGIDEKETGLRAILNYGHTFGHAIEKLHHYEFSHGIAVSLGMRVAGRLSTLTQRWSAAEETRQNSLLDALGFPGTSAVDAQSAWDVMGIDKKVEKDKRVYILPTKIGTVEKATSVNENLVHQAWASIQPGDNV
jgi:3-dehydroquinate synthase